MGFETTKARCWDGSIGWLDVMRLTFGPIITNINSFVIIHGACSDL